MDLEKYIRFRIKNRKPDFSEGNARAFLDDIYKEMGIRGYERHDIFLMINKVLMENLKGL